MGATLVVASYLFWILVAVLTSRRIYACFVLQTANGTLLLMTPQGWIAGWEVLGFALVLLLSVSPWHLLWWIPVGYILTMIVARLLVLAGFRKHLGL